MSVSEVLNAFFTLNPNVDLKKINFNDPNEFATLKWPEGFAPVEVVKELKKARRLFLLHPKSDTSASAVVAVQQQAKKSPLAFMSPGPPVPRSGEKGLLAQFGELESAHQIASSSENRFLDVHGEKFESIEVARKVYQNSVDRVARATHLLANAHTLTSLTTQALRVDNSPVDGSKYFQGLPGYRDLFGSLDYCECAHCKSIFGPAAYFVDILRIITKYIAEPNNGTIPPKMKLRDRRPDLGEIELTCENTNTTIPYLQIVCERLEVLLIGKQKPTDNDLQVFYQKLSDSPYPAEFPFHRPLEQHRVYLSQLKTSPCEIYSAFLVDGDCLAAEYLGMSWDEWKIVTSQQTPTPDIIQARYGVSDWKQLLDVDKFCSQTGLTSSEFTQLIHQDLTESELAAGVQSAFYINQGQNDPIAVNEQGVIQNLKLSSLDRIDRFLRVSRKTNWKYSELDWTLHCVSDGKPEITSSSLVSIAKLVTAISENENLNLNLLQLLLFDLKTYGGGEQGSPFGQVFNPVGTEFTYSPKYKANVTYTDEVHEWNLQDDSQDEQDAGSWIAAGVGLPYSVLKPLVLSLFPNQHILELSVENLSTIYRHCQFSKIISARKTAGEDYQKFLEIFGNATPTLKIDQIQDAVSLSKRFQSVMLNPFEADYILNGTNSLYVNPLYREEDVSNWLQELRKQLPSLPEASQPKDSQQSKDSTGNDLRIIELTANFFSVDSKSLIALTSAIEVKKEMKILSTTGSLDSPTELVNVLLDAKQSDQAKILIKNLSRWMVLVQKLNLTPAEIQALPDFFGSESHTWTLRDIGELVRFKQSTGSWQDKDGFLRKSLSNSNSSDPLSCDYALAQMTGWDQGLITSLKKALPENANKMILLQQMKRIADLVQRTRLGLLLQKRIAALAGKWTNQNWSELESVNFAIISIVRGYFSAGDWSPVQERMDAQIQGKLKQALVARALWILGQKPETEWVKNSRNLYEYLLIDVGMSSCARISYVKEALNASQLYLNRCRQGLEPGITELEIPKVWWEWIMNYRIWEANRKIFLYPENYIDPGIRSSKTALFKEFESQLKQGEINHQAVTAAYKKYLDEFAVLAKLKIVDAYYCNVSDETRDDEPTTYLFARTESEPFLYYYLTRDSAGVWTEWKKIGITINADHISPLYAFDKLFVFWVELKKYDDKSSNEKEHVQKASIKFSFYNFNGDWVQPQTLIEDVVISVDQGEKANEAEKIKYPAQIPREHFNTDHLCWNKVYPLKIERGRYWSIAGGANKVEKVVVLYGPLLDIPQSSEVMTFVRPQVSDDTSVSQFCDQMSKSVNVLNLSAKNSYQGKVSFIKPIVLNEDQEVGFLVNPNEVIVFHDDAPSSLQIFYPKISSATGQLNLVETTNPVSVNYLGSVQAPSIRSSVSVANITNPISASDLIAPGIQQAGAEAIIKQLIVSGFLDQSTNRLFRDIDYTDLRREVASIFSAKESDIRVREVMNVLQVKSESPWISSAMRSKNYEVLSVKNHLTSFLFSGDKEAFLFDRMDSEIPSLSRALFNSDTLFAENSFVSNVASILPEGSRVIFSHLQKTGFLDDAGRLVPGSTISDLRQELKDQSTPTQADVILDILSRQPFILAESLVSTEPEVTEIGAKNVIEQLVNSGYIDQTGRLLADVNFSDLSEGVAAALQGQPRQDVLVDFIVGRIYESCFPTSIGVFVEDAHPNPSGDSRFQITRLTTAAVHHLSSKLFTGGVDKLLSLPSQQIPIEPELPFSRFEFEESRVIAPDASDGGQVDFKGLYGLYYWELFFHAPYYIANLLKSHQQYSDAEKWYQYIFDPTIPESPLTPDVFESSTLGETDSLRIYEILSSPNVNLITPDKQVSLQFNSEVDLAKYFKHLPFTPDQILSIQNVLLNHQLSRPVARYWQFQPFRNHSVAKLQEMLQDQNAISEYNKHPFDPHAIANLRMGAYEKAVVMQYVDNLIQWGDNLFTQYSWESITSATMLYNYAYNLIGDRPLLAGVCKNTAPSSFDDIYAQYTKSKSGIPQFLISLEDDLPDSSRRLHFSPINEVDTFFCVPENDQFLAYWDCLDDRLFKIRHCLNIDGVKQPLPLFQPPIDPAQLMRAAASGADVLSLLNQGGNVPHYRFNVMLERARNFANSVIQFGSSLLVAIEKKDAERLLQLRSTQEKAVLNLTTLMKDKQIEETDESLAALKISQSNVQNRLDHFSKLYDENLNPLEIAELTLRAASVYPQTAAMMTRGLSIAGFLSPKIFGFSNGNMQFGDAIMTGAQIADSAAGLMNHAAGMISTGAQYVRRREDWQLQRDSAQYELTQIAKQITALESRQAILKQELAIHLKNIKQADEYQEFLSAKFSNEDLYQWMIGRLATVYYQSFRLALDTALAAQAAYQAELGRDDSFFELNLWVNQKRGLLAGEGLILALNQMEKAYLENNQRRLEIEKTISLLHLDPVAFMEFKRGINGKLQGELEFMLGEQLFDHDYPGHFDRKIKSISMTIPAVTGPYQNINCTLTQVDNAIVSKDDINLVKQILDPKNEGDISGVRRNWLNNQQVAISRGMDDPGLFQLDFRDERLLPFEGTGAVSRWKLSMPPETNQFDFNSISDIIFKIQYTARNGSTDFADDVKKTMSGHPGYPLQVAKVIDVKQAYRSEWNALFNTQPADGKLHLTLPLQDHAILPNSKSVKPTKLEVYFHTTGSDSFIASDSFLSVKVDENEFQPVVVTNSMGGTNNLNKGEYMTFEFNLKDIPDTISYDQKISSSKLSNLTVFLFFQSDVSV